MKPPPPRAHARLRPTPRGVHPRWAGTPDPRCGAGARHGPAGRGGPRAFALDGLAPRLSPSSYVADGAWLVGNVVVGDHSSVWFGAVIRGDNGAIRIGCRSNIQDGAVIHCLPDGQVLIGEQVSIGHLAVVHGASIGDRCLIGMGALVMDSAQIGDDTLVAAGSVVAGGRRFEPGVLLRGSPASVVRALTARELDGIRGNAAQYVARAERFRRSLQRI